MIGYGINLGVISSQRASDSLENAIITIYNNNNIGTGNGQVQYQGTGPWAHATGNPIMYNGDSSFSNTIGDRVRFTFTGIKFEWWSEKFYHHGICQVWLDGVLIGTVNQYAAIPEPTQLLFSSDILSNGSHVVELVITGDQDVASINHYLVHDYFRVYTPASASIYNWHVSPTGDDNLGTGSLASPFRTIAKANSVVTSGQTIALRAGTYRELATPPANNVTYLKYPGDGLVTISGLELAGETGWTVHSGNIWKKTITLPVAANFASSTGGSNTTLLANQVFRNGEMMHLARWPKIVNPQDMLDKTKMRTLGNTTTFTNNQIVDSGFGALNIAANALTNADISIIGWFLSETRKITSNNGSTINYGNGTINSPAYRKFYHITNALALLTDEKEWWYGSNTLYFRQPGGGSPTGVEYKTRNWGFDLRGRSNITIKGINFIGCEPAQFNSSSTNNIIDNIRVLCQNHAFLTPNSSPDYFYNARQIGMQMQGSGNIIRNSEFKYGIQGVWAGANSKVLNNKFEYYGYDATYASPVCFFNGANGVEIGNNTLSYCGRSNIHMGAYVAGNQTAATFLNLNVHHNDMGYHSMLLVDNGAIYSNIWVNLTGTVIQYNWMHNNMVSRVGGVDGVQVTGVYMDQAAGPVLMHHNVVYSGDECDFYAQQFAGADAGNPARTVQHTHYNNTYAGTTDRSYISYSTGITPDIQRNNIYRGNISASSGSNIANSLMNNQNPLFVGGSLATPHIYFQLQAGSPARGIATAIGGINDTDDNPKDAGAYPYGQAAWTAGYVEVPYAG